MGRKAPLTWFSSEQLAPKFRFSNERSVRHKSEQNLMIFSFEGACYKWEMYA